MDSGREKDLADLHQKLDLLLERTRGIPQRFFSISTASQYTDLSPASIRRLLDSARLTKLRPVKGKVLIDRHQIDAVILASGGQVRVGRGLHRRRGDR